VLRNTCLKTLRDSRRAIAWWSLGLVAMTALMVAVFPAVRDNPQLNDLVDQYPEALKAFIAFGGDLDYTSGAGYLGSELFSFMVPLLLTIAAIGAGARAVAGEEEAGTLDLLLANPLSRRRVVAEKTVALAVELLTLSVVLFASLLAGVGAVGMGVSATHLAGASAAAALLAFAFGALAVLAGALSGRRGAAIAVSAGAAVAAYLLNSLGPLVDLPGPVRALSPYYHYVVSDPLRQGLEADHVAILLAVGLAAAVAAAVAFEHRDVAA
jgi:beta-exotoxin I transport system permease protein